MYVYVVISRTYYTRNICMYYVNPRSTYRKNSYVARTLILSQTDRVGEIYLSISVSLYRDYADAVTYKWGQDGRHLHSLRLS